MTSEDFAKIFYSNFIPSIDWANLDEIAWMYGEGLFKVFCQELASPEEFIKRNGESLNHIALKSFATDYLFKQYGIPKENVIYEYPLIGFEADVIDKNLYYPVECGDTNALKLEKYLTLPSTKKMLILPYPRSGNVRVFEFCANPRFFEYIKHKKIFLNQQRAKFR